jgi:drug/metabolite transporter (DMT)-like permease
MKISRGIQYMLLSSLCFALIGWIIRLLAHLPVAEIVFFYSIIALTISFSILRYEKISIWGNSPKLLLVRGLSAGVGIILFFSTLLRLPLAIANVLQNTSPIFTAILGIFMLKQPVRPRRWLFFIVAFLGVSLTYATNFSSASKTIYLIVIGLISAFLMGIANNLNAKMKKKEHPIVIFSYSKLCTALLTGFYCLYNFVPLTAYDCLRLLILGGLTYIAEYLAITAYQKSPVAHVSAISYLGIPYAIIIDLLLGEKFHWLSFVGMGLVILGVLLNMFYD